MSPARKVVSALAFAGWLLVLVRLWVWRDDNWNHYIESHHCKPAYASEMWSYVPLMCPGCVPVFMSEDTYVCDYGERIER